MGETTKGQTVADTKGRQRLFALYADVILPATGSTAWAERQQFIIMPPCPREFNGSTLKNATETAHVFFRHQQEPGHRAVWQHRLAKAADPSDGETMKTFIQRHELTGWQAGPLVVVELLPEEIEDAGTGRTPWPVLNRMKRVAAKRHARMI